MTVGSIAREFLADKSAPFGRVVLKQTHLVFFSSVLLWFLACSKPEEPERVTLTDFALEDVNPRSATYGELIGPSYYEGKVSAYYFGDAGGEICQRRFGVLNDLYNQLIAEGVYDVKIMGVNGIEYAAHDKSKMISGRVLPWTQDTEAEDAWKEWNVTIRGFFILDASGQFLDKLNLTLFDPDPSYGGGVNYQILKSMLMDARGP